MLVNVRMNIRVETAVTTVHIMSCVSNTWKILESVRIILV